MEFLIRLIEAVWATGIALAPSLLIGLLVAGVLHVFVKRDRIFKHLGKPGPGSVVKASLIGVPLPLCSCGVLPAALSLRNDGASKGAAVSFLSSTPQTGVDSILPTWAMLGWQVALAKVIAAFSAGIISGTITDHLDKDDSTARPAEANSETETGSVPGRIWRYAFGTLFRDIYLWLLIGILVSALITLFIEPGQLARYPLLNGPLGTVAALAIGIPMYVCSVSSIPIAAALVYAGFPVGSALVFLMAGPVTNAATMGAVRKKMGKVSFYSYIITVIVISLVAGLLLNDLDISGVSATHLHSGSSPVQTTSAALLFLGILYWSVRELRVKLFRRVDSSGIQGIVYNVSGMSCGNCVKKVQDSLVALPGISAAQVSLDSGTATVVPASAYSEAEVLAVLEKAGYSGEKHIAVNEGCECGECERR